MLWRMYSIYDRVAEESMPCFCAKNDGVAIRGFRQGLKDASRPEEYQLYYVGTFDDVKMMVQGVDLACEVIIPQEVK